MPTKGTKNTRTKKPGSRLTELFTPALMLPHPLTGKLIAVRPPGHEDGLILTALYSHMADISIALFKGEEPDKCPECGQYTRMSARPEVRAAFEANKERQIEEVSLGHDVYSQLQTDGVPDADIHKLGLYAMYYWILGEDSAEEWLSNELGEPAEDDNPKA